MPKTVHGRKVPAKAHRAYKHAYADAKRRGKSDQSARKIAMHAMQAAMGKKRTKK